MRTSHLREEDLEESFVRSSGPGGQNVNKVASKVTLRHIPTNISVAIQDSRSQAANRKLARARLLEAVQKHEQAIAARRQQLVEKKRRQNAPRPQRVKARLVEGKRRRAAVKQLRGRVTDA